MIGKPEGGIADSRGETRAARADLTPLPTVSVIVPVLNGASYIPKAIESVLAQSFEDFELIIVDDGSTDGTAAVVRAYDDTRIRYFYQQNRGLSAARNSGIRIARGGWLAFLDCDDYWHPGKLSAQLDAARRVPDAGLIYCAATSTTMDGEVICEIPALIEGAVLPELLRGNRVAGSASSAMVRREVFDRVGIFDEELRCSEDWDMWLRVAAVTTVARVETPLVCCRNTPGSLGKKVAVLRDSNLKILSRAFDTYASGFRRLRRRAHSIVHLTAAINYQEMGAFAEARAELLRSAGFQPFTVRLYWRLARALVRRR